MKILCRYHQRGTCNRGERCLYRHELKPTKNSENFQKGTVEQRMGQLEIILTELKGQIQKISSPNNPHHHYTFTQVPQFPQPQEPIVRMLPPQMRMLPPQMGQRVI